MGNFVTYPMRGAKTKSYERKGSERFDWFFVGRWSGVFWAIFVPNDRRGVSEVFRGEPGVL